jgi:hypothetical protein
MAKKSYEQKLYELGYRYKLEVIGSSGFIFGTQHTTKKGAENMALRDMKRLKGKSYKIYKIKGE